MCKCSREMGFRIGRVEVHYEFTICVSVPGRWASGLEGLRSIMSLQYV